MNAFLYRNQKKKSKLFKITIFLRKQEECSNSTLFVCFHKISGKKHPHIMKLALKYPNFMKFGTYIKPHVLQKSHHWALCITRVLIPFVWCGYIKSLDHQHIHCGCYKGSVTVPHIKVFFVNVFIEISMIVLYMQ